MLFILAKVDKQYILVLVIPSKADKQPIPMLVIPAKAGIQYAKTLLALSEYLWNSIKLEYRTVIYSFDQ